MKDDGDDGYKHFDSFHKKNGDKYGFETFSSYGAHEHGEKSGAIANDDNDGEEGAEGGDGEEKEQADGEECKLRDTRRARGR